MRQTSIFLALTRVLCLVALSIALMAQNGERRVQPVDSLRKLALVIGNDAYPAMPLRNAVNDARSMSAVLRDLGFEVSEVTNVDLKRFHQGVDRFIGEIRPGDVALFYYSGHGLQIAGENYLVPIDYQTQDEADAKFSTYEARRVQERMEGAVARLNIVILDACRNNPWRTSRSAAGGLAPMIAGKDTIIAMATAPGKTANDKPGGNNGLFTQHLVSALRQPGGTTLDGLFSQVREAVYRASNGQQTPWTISSVIGEYSFQASSAPTSVSTPPLSVSGNEAEIVFWKSVENSKKPEEYRAYLTAYPNGAFAPLARARLKTLDAPAVNSPPAATATAKTFAVQTPRAAASLTISSAGVKLDGPQSFEYSCAEVLKVSSSAIPGAKSKWKVAQPPVTPVFFLFRNHFMAQIGSLNDSERAQILGAVVTSCGL